MLALSLENEHLLYGDIIRQEFLDTYDNLTLKTIKAFKWVIEFCPNARYIMKTDTDVFINTGKLVYYLLDLSHSEKFFTGYPLIDIYPYRRFYQKAYISYSDYTFSGKESACQCRRHKIPGSERSLKEGMATHSSILAWRTPWTEEPDGLQSIGSQRVRHN